LDIHAEAMLTPNHQTSLFRPKIYQRSALYLNGP